MYGEGGPPSHSPSLAYNLPFSAAALCRGFSMATGGALWLCAVFFLSIAHHACSCPEIFRDSCTGNKSVSEDWQPCGDDSFRCNDSSMEIRFGGTDPPFKVIGKDTTGGRKLVRIEDPFLSPMFKNTDCDFLYSFPSPRPLFSHRLSGPPDDLPSYCNDYRVLFSKLTEAYQQINCITYDLYCKPKELVRYAGDPALHEACPAADVLPAFIWELSYDTEFYVVSAGFSSRHRLDQRCFDCSMTGGRCDSAEAGYYACGNTVQEKQRSKTFKIVGFSTAAGVSIIAIFLLLYLWCRKKVTKTPSSSILLSQTASLRTPSEKDPEELSINYPTHVFRYQELHEATNGFSRANELDQGGHGAVYGGTLRDGRAVAVKRLYENSFRRGELFMNEIAILSRLRHPNLVVLYGCTSRHSRELLLVYEFIPNGTIADHLHGHRAAKGALTWPLRLRIAVETATALAYLHAVEPPIVHRDVKTKNILLDRDFNVKVGDFGLSRLFPVAASHVSTVPQGTPGYVDPEYHRCYQLTDKSDVYSFGVVLAELISSKPAVDVTRSRREINLSSMALIKIQNAALQELVDPKLGFETDWEVRRSIQLVAELAMRCLQGERDTRPTMEDVLEVLRGIENVLRRAEEGREVDHAAGDVVGMHKNCPAASPDSVTGTWLSRTSTPDASG